MFTLKQDQEDIKNKTVIKDKTYNGSKRQVALTSIAVRRFQEYMAVVNAQQRGMEGFAFVPGAMLFPWWGGAQDKAELTRVTMLLSHHFARIFAAAGCNG